MKLHKLVDYSRVWVIVADVNPLFVEPLEAWSNGPIIPALYQLHRGQFRVMKWLAGAKVTEDGRDTVDHVIKVYPSYTAYQLSDLTHGESTYSEVRRRLNERERGSGVRDHASLADVTKALSTNTSNVLNSPVVRDRKNPQHRQYFFIKRTKA